MSTEQMGTYEKIYFALWELGQRYGNFVQFRVIGRSHDDRMIPMLEIGKGDTCIICLSGVESGDRNLPEYLCPLQKITADPMKATGPSEKVMKFVNFWIRFVSV